MAQIEWNFPVKGNNFELAGDASQRTKSHLKQLGIPDTVIRKVVIAMYEGEINMVIHANGGNAKVVVKSDQIVVTLTDSGNGIANVDLAMKEGYSTATTQIREMGFGAGMGLPNMKKYSDDMQIDTEVGVGTTITMKFNL